MNTLAAFQASNAFLVRSPAVATKVSPKPARALLIGLFFGSLLAVGAALLRNRLDTRVQSADELSQELGLPLLAGIPELPKKMRQAHELVMLSDPHGTDSEAFRVLRTSVEFGAIDDDIRTIIVSSAVQTEGKSTTVANLALAFARAGRRVVLVDLDLRRPDPPPKFFGLVGRPGLSDVALGRLPLHEALVDLDISARTSTVEGAGRTKGSRTGRVCPVRPGSRPRTSAAAAASESCTSGPMPPDTGEFVVSDRVRDILTELASRRRHRLGGCSSLANCERRGHHQPSCKRDAVRRTTWGGPPSDAHRPSPDARQTSHARPRALVATGVQSSQTHGYGYGYGYHATNETMEAPPEVATTSAIPRSTR